MPSQPPYRRTSLPMLLWQAVVLIGLNVVSFGIMQLAQIGPYQEHHDYLRGTIIGGAFLVFLDLVLILLFIRMQGRPLADSGLVGGFKAPLLFLAGMALWWASASALSLLFGWQWVQNPSVHWNGSFSLLLILTFFSTMLVLILPIELVNHGFIFPVLQQYSVVLALVIPGLLLLPLPLLMESPGVALLLFALSIIAGLLRWASGTLWLPLGFLGTMLTAAETLKIQSADGGIDSFTVSQLPLFVGPSIVAALIAVVILLARKTRTGQQETPLGRGPQW